jgi:hypothetical protein
MKRNFHRRGTEQVAGCGPDLYQNLARILYLAMVLDVFSAKWCADRWADQMTTTWS